MTKIKKSRRRPKSPLYRDIKPSTLPFCLLTLQRQVLDDIVVLGFEFGHQALVGEIERMRVFPVLVHDFVDPLDDMFVPHFDSKLATAVEATGSEVDGTDDRSHPVGEKQLGVKFQPFELVYLDAHICLLYTSDAADEE